jgi:hypothetical protein
MILGILASAGGAAASSYESIATATGTGSSGTITFSSISSGYTHLQLRMLTRDAFATTGIDYVKLRFNSDTGTNYARHQLKGDGATATATGAITLDNILLYGHPLGSNTANVMGTYVVDILDYASTAKYKTVRSLSGCDLNATGQILITSGLWLNTNAVSTITIDAGGTFFTTSSTFALYGIKAAA